MTTATSPCIKICVIIEANGLCRGCGRTLEEIAAWGGLGADAQKSIMDELPARIAAFGAEFDEGVPA